jgi:hypothetical protein
MRRGQRAAAPRRLWLRGRRGDDTSSFPEHPGGAGSRSRSSSVALAGRLAALRRE